MLLSGLLSIGVYYNRSNVRVFHSALAGSMSGGDGGELKDFAEDANNGDTYTLTNDIVTDEHDDRVIVDDENKRKNAKQ